MVIFVLDDDDEPPPVADDEVVEEPLSSVTSLDAYVANPVGESSGGLYTIVAAEQQDADVSPEGLGLYQPVEVGSTTYGFPYFGFVGYASLPLEDVAEASDPAAPSSEGATLSLDTYGDLYWADIDISLLENDPLHPVLDSDDDGDRVTKSFLIELESATRRAELAALYRWTRYSA